MSDDNPLELDIGIGDESHEPPEREYEGYADYRTISNRLGSDISRAVDAYAQLDSYQRERADLRPKAAAKARGCILAAALKLLAEMEAQADDGTDKYDGYITTWTTSKDTDPDTAPADDLGYIDRLESLTFAGNSQGCPRWLRKFVFEIRRAGWELGYLKAGREVEQYNDDDPVEQESDSALA